MYRIIASVSAIVFLAVLPAFAGKGALRIAVFPTPPNISASLEFSEPSGNKILDGEEVGKLIITVKNDGKGDAFDVNAEVEASKRIKGLSYDSKIPFGTVPSGESVTKTLQLQTDDELEGAEIDFEIRLREANGFDADPLRIRFKTKTFQPPKLVVADLGINDQNANSMIEPMENVELTARIQNTGYGDARDVSVNIETGENVFIAGEAVTRFVLGNIMSGQFKDVTFMFYSNKRIKNGEKIPISLKILEARNKFNAVEPLDLVMNARQKSTQEIVVKGVESPKGEIELAGGLSVDVDMRIPEGIHAGKYDIAVVIGNKHYTAPGVPEVEYADRDARIMKEYLIRTFGFEQGNIIYEENATFAKFNEIFGTQNNPNGRLSGFVKKGVSNVFVYYAGHGAPDLDSTEAYFLPVDANPQYIANNGYRLQTFYENLSKIPIKKITIVLDTCFSGNSGKGMLFKNISPAMVKVKKDYRGPGNAILITSAAMDQVSSWYPDKKHSLFTYYFLKGLQGEADVNKDRVITTGEIEAYLKENVSYWALRLNGVAQNPVVTGGGSEVLVELKK